MKKLFVAGALCAALCLCGCKSTAAAAAKSADNAQVVFFSDFTLDGDLSWLYGTWELVEWKVDNHGTWEDSAIYEYQLLEVNGKEKSSPLIEESKTAKDGKVSKYEYTVESFFTLNNHTKGHSNKVSGDKTMLLLTREFARDTDVIFYYLFRKK